MINSEENQNPTAATAQTGFNNNSLKSSIFKYKYAQHEWVLYDIAWNGMQLHGFVSV